MKITFLGGGNMANALIGGLRQGLDDGARIARIGVAEGRR